MTIGLVDEIRKLLYVREIMDATHFTGVWRGQAYECRAFPNTDCLSVGDAAFCHVIPGNTELFTTCRVVGENLRSYYADLSTRLTFWYNGKRYVVAKRNLGPMVYRVVSTAGYGTFTRLDQVNEPGGILGYTSLIVRNMDARLDPDGHTIHIIIRFNKAGAAADANQVQYSQFDMATNSWVMSEIANTFPNQNNLHLYLTVDSAGVPYIIRSTLIAAPVLDRYLYCQPRTGGVWGAEETILHWLAVPPGLDYYELYTISPDVDSADTIHVLVGRKPAAGGVSESWHYSRVAGVWGIVAVNPFTPPITWGDMKKMWIDQADAIHVMINDGVLPFDGYRFWYNGAWNNEVVLAAVGTFRPVQITVTSDNIPRVLWSPSAVDRHIWETHYSGGVWSAAVDLGVFFAASAYGFAPDFIVNSTRPGYIDYTGVSSGAINVMYKQVAAP